MKQVKKRQFSGRIHTRLRADYHVLRLKFDFFPFSFAACSKPPSILLLKPPCSKPPCLKPALVVRVLSKDTTPWAEWEFNQDHAIMVVVKLTLLPS